MNIPWAPEPIPRNQPAQVHLSHGLDQWLGDSKKAPKAAGPDGCTDTNLQPLLDGVGCIHAELPLHTGWRWLAMGKGRPRRPLEHDELLIPFSKWPKAKFVRLRRTRFAGPSFESRVRPLLFVESVHFHKVYGAIMVAEVKKKIPERMVRSMLETAARQQVTVWFKRLPHQGVTDPKPGYSMAAAGEVAAEFHAAHAPIALATHGYPPPADLEQYRHLFTAIWGPNAKEYR